MKWKDFVNAFANGIGLGVGAIFIIGGRNMQTVVFGIVIVVVFVLNMACNFSNKLTRR